MFNRVGRMVAAEELRARTRGPIGTTPGLRGIVYAKLDKGDDTDGVELARMKGRRAGVIGTGAGVSRLRGAVSMPLDADAGPRDGGRDDSAGMVEASNMGRRP